MGPARISHAVGGDIALCRRVAEDVGFGLAVGEQKIEQDERSAIRKRDDEEREPISARIVHPADQHREQHDQRKANVQNGGDRFSDMRLCGVGRRKQQAGAAQTPPDGDDRQDLEPGRETRQAAAKIGRIAEAPAQPAPGFADGTWRRGDVMSSQPSAGQRGDIGDDGGEDEPAEPADPVGAGRGGV